MNSIIDHARDTEDYPVYPIYLDPEVEYLWYIVREMHKADEEKIKSWGEQDA